jgi:hypothetical protein
MRKLATILFSASLILFLSLPVSAGLYSPDLVTIQGMSKTWDAVGTTSTVPIKLTVGSTVTFAAAMQFGDGFSNGWAQQGVGYGWPPPAVAQDLSAYNGYALTFKNSNNSSWFVNLYMNTGWVDNGELNHFYQDGWVELLPGVSTVVTLDFSAVSAINLNHVTTIGFEIGGNMEWPSVNPSNPSNGDIYHIDVSQIPEPVTLALLGLGAVALRRRK